MAVKRTYIGSHAAIVLPDEREVKRGETIEVEDEDVKSLDESGNWSTPAKAVHELDEKE